MNHPTRREFDELKEEVRKLKEQHTEPMKVVLEQRPTEGETKLLETLLLQSGQQATAIGILQHDVSVSQKITAEIKADILQLRESQADFKDTLTAMKTTQDEQGVMLSEVLEWVRKQKGE